MAVKYGVPVCVKFGANFDKRSKNKNGPTNIKYKINITIANRVNAISSLRRLLRINAVLALCFMNK
jgi:hypothetical protein